MSNVRVAVRVRPLSGKEKDKGGNQIVTCSGDNLSITNVKLEGIPEYADSRERAKHFTFDYCYDSMGKPQEQGFASQELVYQDLGTEVLQAAVEGYNACLFAYGQTSTGKTYTMMGMPGEVGVIPRIGEGLFSHIEDDQDANKTLKVDVSYLEIYNERVRDLLHQAEHGTSERYTLKVREHPKEGPYVQDLTKHYAKDFEDFQTLLDKGNESRTTAATHMHEHSSRSHAIFTIVFTQAMMEDGLPHEIVSKIHLVDLAGSERADPSYTSDYKGRLKEGANINKSLVTLGNVIKALAEKSLLSWSMDNMGSTQSFQSGGGGESLSSPSSSPRRHRSLYIPYRDSVLTWLLKDSLGGNSKTIMIATISPASIYYNESISTLRYAQRAKCIINKPKVNEDPNVAIIRELRREIFNLKNLLESTQGADADSAISKMLEKDQSMVQQLTKQWNDKWSVAHSIMKDSEMSIQGLGRRSSSHGILIDLHLPYFIALDEDVLSTGIEIFNLKEGITRIGCESPHHRNPDIVLSGSSIKPDHCAVKNQRGEVTLYPHTGAIVTINGRDITEPTLLTQGDAVFLGKTHRFRYKNPAEAARLRDHRRSLQDGSLELGTSMSSLQEFDTPPAHHSTMPVMFNPKLDSAETCVELERKYKTEQEKVEQAQLELDRVTAQLSKVKETKEEIEECMWKSHNDKMAALEEEKQQLVEMIQRTQEERDLALDELKEARIKLQEEDKEEREKLQHEVQKVLKLKGKQDGDRSAETVGIQTDSSASDSSEEIPIGGPTGREIKLRKTSVEGRLKNVLVKEIQSKALHTEKIKELEAQEKEVEEQYIESQEEFAKTEQVIHNDLKQIRQEDFSHYHDISTKEEEVEKLEKKGEQLQAYIEEKRDLQKVESDTPKLQRIACSLEKLSAIKEEQQLIPRTRSLLSVRDKSAATIRDRLSEDNDNSSCFSLSSSSEGGMPRHARKKTKSKPLSQKALNITERLYRVSPPRYDYLKKNTSSRPSSPIHSPSRTVLESPEVLPKFDYLRRKPKTDPQPSTSQPFISRRVKRPKPDPSIKRPFLKKGQGHMSSSYPSLLHGKFHRNRSKGQDIHADLTKSLDGLKEADPESLSSEKIKLGDSSHSFLNPDNITSPKTKRYRPLSRSASRASSLASVPEAIAEEEVAESYLHSVPNVSIDTSSVVRRKKRQHSPGWERPTSMPVGDEMRYALADFGNSMQNTSREGVHYVECKSGNLVWTSSQEELTDSQSGDISSVIDSQCKDLSDSSGTDATTVHGPGSMISSIDSVLENAVEETANNAPCTDCSETPRAVGKHNVNQDENIVNSDSSDKPNAIEERCVSPNDAICKDDRPEEGHACGSTKKGSALMPFLNKQPKKIKKNQDDIPVEIFLPQTRKYSAGEVKSKETAQCTEDKTHVGLPISDSAAKTDTNKDIINQPGNEKLNIETNINEDEDLNTSEQNVSFSGDSLDGHSHCDQTNNKEGADAAVLHSSSRLDVGDDIDGNDQTERSALCSLVEVDEHSQLSDDTSPSPEDTQRQIQALQEVLQHLDSPRTVTGTSHTTGRRNKRQRTRPKDVESDSQEQFSDDSLAGSGNHSRQSSRPGSGSRRRRRPASKSSEAALKKRKGHTSDEYQTSDNDSLYSDDSLTHSDDKHNAEHGQNKEMVDEITTISQSVQQLTADLDTLDNLQGIDNQEVSLDLGTVIQTFIQPQTEPPPFQGLTEVHLETNVPAESYTKMSSDFTQTEGGSVQMRLSPVNMWSSEEGESFSPLLKEKATVETKHQQLHGSHAAIKRPLKLSVTPTEVWTNNPEVSLERGNRDTSEMIADDSLQRVDLDNNDGESRAKKKKLSSNTLTEYNNGNSRELKRAPTIKYEVTINEDNTDIMYNVEKTEYRTYALKPVSSDGQLANTSSAIPDTININLTETRTFQQEDRFQSVTKEKVLLQKDGSLCDTNDMGIITSEKMYESSHSLDCEEVVRGSDVSRGSSVERQFVQEDFVSAAYGSQTDTETESVQTKTIQDPDANKEKGKMLVYESISFNTPDDQTFQKSLKELSGGHYDPDSTLIHSNELSLTTIAPTLQVDDATIPNRPGNVQQNISLESGINILPTLRTLPPSIDGIEQKTGNISHTDLSEVENDSLGEEVSDMSDDSLDLSSEPKPPKITWSESPTQSSGSQSYSSSVPASAGNIETLKAMDVHRDLPQWQTETITLDEKKDDFTKQPEQGQGETSVASHISRSHSPWVLIEKAEIGPTAEEKENYDAHVSSAECEVGDAFSSVTQYGSVPLVMDDTAVQTRLINPAHIHIQTAPHLERETLGPSHFVKSENEPDSQLMVCTNIDDFQYGKEGKEMVGKDICVKLQEHEGSDNQVQHFESYHTLLPDILEETDEQIVGSSPEHNIMANQNFDTSSEREKPTSNMERQQIVAPKNDEKLVSHKSEYENHLEEDYSEEAIVKNATKPVHETLMPGDSNHSEMSRLIDQLSPRNENLKEETPDRADDSSTQPIAFCDTDKQKCLSLMDADLPSDVDIPATRISTHHNIARTTDVAKVDPATLLVGGGTGNTADTEPTDANRYTSFADIKDYTSDLNETHPSHDSSNDSLDENNTSLYSKQEVLLADTLMESRRDADVSDSKSHTVLFPIKTRRHLSESDNNSAESRISPHERSVISIGVHGGDKDEENDTSVVASQIRSSQSPLSMQHFAVVDVTSPVRVGVSKHDRTMNDCDQKGSGVAQYRKDNIFRELRSETGPNSEQLSKGEEMLSLESTKDASDGSPKDNSVVGVRDDDEKYPPSENTCVMGSDGLHILKGAQNLSPKVNSSVTHCLKTFNMDATAEAINQMDLVDDFYGRNQKNIVKQVAEPELRSPSEQHTSDVQTPVGVEVFAAGVQGDNIGNTSENNQRDYTVVSGRHDVDSDTADTGKNNENNIRQEISISQQQDAQRFDDVEAFVDDVDKDNKQTCYKTDINDCSVDFEEEVKGEGISQPDQMTSSVQPTPTEPRLGELKGSVTDFKSSAVHTDQTETVTEIGPDNGIVAIERDKGNGAQKILSPTFLSISDLQELGNVKVPANSVPTDDIGSINCDYQESGIKSLERDEGDNREHNFLPSPYVKRLDHKVTSITNDTIETRCDEDQEYGTAAVGEDWNNKIKQMADTSNKQTFHPSDNTKTDMDQENNQELTRKERNFIREVEESDTISPSQVIDNQQLSKIKSSDASRNCKGTIHETNIETDTPIIHERGYIEREAQSQILTPLFHVSSHSKSLGDIKDYVTRAHTGPGNEEDQGSETTGVGKDEENALWKGTDCMNRPSTFHFTAYGDKVIQVMPDITAALGDNKGAVDENEGADGDVVPGGDGGNHVHQCGIICPSLQFTEGKKRSCETKSSDTSSQNPGIIYKSVEEYPTPVVDRDDFQDDDSVTGGNGSHKIIMLFPSKHHVGDEKNSFARKSPPAVSREITGTINEMVQEDGTVILKKDEKENIKNVSDSQISTSSLNPRSDVQRAGDIDTSSISINRDFTESINEGDNNANIEREEENSDRQVDESGISSKQHADKAMPPVASPSRNYRATRNHEDQDSGKKHNIGKHESDALETQIMSASLQPSQDGDRQVDITGSVNEYHQKNGNTDIEENDRQASKSALILATSQLSSEKQSHPEVKACISAETSDDTETVNDKGQQDKDVDRADQSEVISPTLEYDTKQQRFGKMKSPESTAFRDPNKSGAMNEKSLDDRDEGDKKELMPGAQILLPSLHPDANRVDDKKTHVTYFTNNQKAGTKFGERDQENDFEPNIQSETVITSSQGSTDMQVLEEVNSSVTAASSDYSGGYSKDAAPKDTTGSINRKEQEVATTCPEEDKGNDIKAVNESENFSPIIECTTVNQRLHARMSPLTAASREHQETGNKMDQEDGNVAIERNEGRRINGSKMNERNEADTKQVALPQVITASLQSSPDVQRLGKHSAPQTDDSGCLMETINQTTQEGSSAVMEKDKGADTKKVSEPEIVTSSLNSSLNEQRSGDIEEPLPYVKRDHKGENNEDDRADVGRDQKKTDRRVNETGITSSLQTFPDDQKVTAIRSTEIIAPRDKIETVTDVQRLNEMELCQTTAYRDQTGSMYEFGQEYHLASTGKDEGEDINQVVKSQVISSHLHTSPNVQKEKEDRNDIMEIDKGDFEQMAQSIHVSPNVDRPTVVQPKSKSTSLQASPFKILSNVTGTINEKQQEDGNAAIKSDEGGKGQVKELGIITTLNQLSPGRQRHPDVNTCVNVETADDTQTAKDESQEDHTVVGVDKSEIISPSLELDTNPQRFGEMKSLASTAYRDPNRYGAMNEKCLEDRDETDNKELMTGAQTLPPSRQLDAKRLGDMKSQVSHYTEDPDSGTTMERNLEDDMEQQHNCPVCIMDEKGSGAFSDDTSHGDYMTIAQKPMVTSDGLSSAASATTDQVTVIESEKDNTTRGENENGKRNTLTILVSHKTTAGNKELNNTAVTHSSEGEAIASSIPAIEMNSCSAKMLKDETHLSMTDRKVPLKVDSADHTEVLKNKVQTDDDTLDEREDRIVLTTREARITFPEQQPTLDVERLSSISEKIIIGSDNIPQKMTTTHPSTDDSHLPLSRDMNATPMTASHLDTDSTVGQIDGNSNIPYRNENQLANISTSWIHGPLVGHSISLPSLDSWTDARQESGLEVVKNPNNVTSAGETSLNEVEKNPKDSCVFGPSEPAKIHLTYSDTKGIDSLEETCEILQPGQLNTIDKEMETLAKELHQELPASRNVQLFKSLRIDNHDNENLLLPSDRLPQRHSEELGTMRIKQSSPFPDTSTENSDDVYLSLEDQTSEESTTSSDYKTPQQSPRFVDLETEDVDLPVVSCESDSSDSWLYLLQPKEISQDSKNIPEQTSVPSTHEVKSQSKNQNRIHGLVSNVNRIENEFERKVLRREVEAEIKKLKDQSRCLSDSAIGSDFTDIEPISPTSSQITETFMQPVMPDMSLDREKTSQTKDMFPTLDTSVKFSGNVAAGCDDAKTLQTAATNREVDFEKATFDPRENRNLVSDSTASGGKSGSQSTGLISNEITTSNENKELHNMTLLSPEKPPSNVSEESGMLKLWPQHPLMEGSLPHERASADSETDHDGPSSSSSDDSILFLIPMSDNERSQTRDSMPVSKVHHKKTVENANTCNGEEKKCGKGSYHHMDVEVNRKPKLTLQKIDNDSHPGSVADNVVFFPSDYSNMSPPTEQLHTAGTRLLDSDFQKKSFPSDADKLSSAVATKDIVSAHTFAETEPKMDDEDPIKYSDIGDSIQSTEYGQEDSTIHVTVSPEFGEILLKPRLEEKHEPITSTLIEHTLPEDVKSEVTKVLFKDHDKSTPMTVVNPEIPVIEQNSERFCLFEECELHDSQSSVETSKDGDRKKFSYHGGHFKNEDDVILLNLQSHSFSDEPDVNVQTGNQFSKNISRQISGNNTLTQSENFPSSKKSLPVTEDIPNSSLRNINESLTRGDAAYTDKIQNTELTVFKDAFSATADRNCYNKAEYSALHQMENGRSSVQKDIHSIELLEKLSYQVQGVILKECGTQTENSPDTDTDMRYLHPSHVMTSNSSQTESSEEEYLSRLMEDSGLGSSAASLSVVSLASSFTNVSTQTDTSFPKNYATRWLGTPDPADDNLGSTVLKGNSTRKSAVFTRNYLDTINQEPPMQSYASVQTSCFDKGINTGDSESQADITKNDPRIQKSSLSVNESNLQQSGYFDTPDSETDEDKSVRKFFHLCTDDIDSTFTQEISADASTFVNLSSQVHASAQTDPETFSEDLDVENTLAELQHQDKCVSVDFMDSVNVSVQTDTEVDIDSVIPQGEKQESQIQSFIPEEVMRTGESKYLQDISVDTGSLFDTNTEVQTGDGSLLMKNRMTRSVEVNTDHLPLFVNTESQTESHILTIDEHDRLSDSELLTAPLDLNSLYSQVTDILDDSFQESEACDTHLLQDNSEIRVDSSFPPQLVKLGSEIEELRKEHSRMIELLERSREKTPRRHQEQGSKVSPVSSSSNSLSPVTVIEQGSSTNGSPSDSYREELLQHSDNSKLEQNNAMAKEVKNVPLSLNTEHKGGDSVINCEMNSSDDFALSEQLHSEEYELDYNKADEEGRSHVQSQTQGHLHQTSNLEKNHGSTQTNLESNIQVQSSQPTQNKSRSEEAYIPFDTATNDDLVEDVLSDSNTHVSDNVSTYDTVDNINVKKYVNRGVEALVDSSDEFTQTDHEDSVFDSSFSSDRYFRKPSVRTASRDTQRIQSELERLERERVEIIELLSLNYLPTSLTVELLEAKMNYCIGQTDMLLASLEDSWEKEYSELTVNTDGLSKVSKEYLAKYKMQFKQSKREMEACLETKQRQKSGGRGRTKTRKRDLVNMRRRAQIEAFKIERLREEQMHQRTRSYSPLKTTASVLTERGLSSPTTPTSSDFIPKYMTLRQRKKHHAELRRHVVAASEDELQQLRSRSVSPVSDYSFAESRYSLNSSRESSFSPERSVSSPSAYSRNSHSAPRPYSSGHTVLDTRNKHHTTGSAYRGYKSYYVDQPPSRYPSVAQILSSGVDPEQMIEETTTIRQLNQRQIFEAETSLRQLEARSRQLSLRKTSSPRLSSGSEISPVFDRDRTNITQTAIDEEIQSMREHYSRSSGSPDLLDISPRYASRSPSPSSPGSYSSYAAYARDHLARSERRIQSILTSSTVSSPRISPRAWYDHARGNSPSPAPSVVSDIHGSLESLAESSSTSYMSFASNILHGDENRYSRSRPISSADVKERIQKRSIRRKD